MDERVVIATSATRRTPLARYHDMDLAARIEGSSPHALVALLYAELLVTLDVLARAVDRFVHHERAASILTALETGLDPAGGGLARDLGAIYRAMRRRLTAVRGGDLGALADLREGVAALAASWNQLV